MPNLEINFEPGVIVHVSGSNFVGQKPKDRYYMIISTFSKIPANDHFICLAISTWDGNDPFMIKILQQDYERGKLDRPSQIICDHMFTFLKSRVDSEKCKVTPFFYDKVKKLLKEKILDL